MNTKTEIYLRKSGKVIVERGTASCSTVTVATFGKNLESLGFFLTRPLFERLLTLSPDQIDDFGTKVLPILKVMVGAHVAYKPFYPNFPAQVMEASDLELYINAMAHYWGFVISDIVGDPSLVFLPHYEKIERAPLTEPVKLKPIGLGDQSDFEAIFTRLSSANSSISDDDKLVLGWFVGEHRKDIARLLPESIPQKETLAFLLGELLKYDAQDLLLGKLKTATDILRVATALSGGDVSLAKNTKFAKLGRKIRRLLLTALEQCGNPTEDMLRHKGKWIKLGERLHPGEFKDKFPKTFASFDVLRNDKPFVTFASAVEQHLLKGNMSDAVIRLKDRPGDFARRLDHVLRKGGDATSFLEVADKVSTPVLVQLHGFFKGRLKKNSLRAFMPKGSVAKMQVLPNTLPEVPAKQVDTLIDGVRNTLVERFKALPPLGKVFIDPALKTQYVPFGQRSASRALRTLARGSRVALGDGNTVRFFIWWKNGDSRVDLDLSAALYGEDWTKKQDVAYYNLRYGDNAQGFTAVHSGDVTSAPAGACEFIDMDIAGVLKTGARYVMMVVTSYTSQPFRELPECFAGWMLREKPQSGEVFEGRTVQNKIDLTVDSQLALPLIIDLQDRQVIWADLALKNKARYINLHGNADNVSLMCRAVAEWARPTLYDLLSMHVEARGVPVDLPAEADLVCSLDGGLTPYDVDRILSEFLG
jgi:hypothetical protein